MNLENFTDLYRQPKFFIDGKWRVGHGAIHTDLVNPANGQTLARYVSASSAEFDETLAAANRSFALWKAVAAFDRGVILKKAAALMRERCEMISTLLTLEQGKPIAEARVEVLRTADMFEWFAEEAVRAYGRIIPPREAGLRQMVTREPVGPVLALCSWNFPARNPGFKIAAALAAGCSVIVKPAEETPLTCIAIAEALIDAGLPAGVLNVVYGDAATLSAHLIASPIIRKITFTGSTQVGKHLARLSADTVKKMTLELGGHAPVIVCDDADIELAVKLIVPLKFRNAGQVCVSPTRFYVHESKYREFVSRFADYAKQLVVGDGLDAKTVMGPMVHGRRRNDVAGFVEDARQQHAKVVCGGNSLDRDGFFYAPTVISDLPPSAKLMNEEPFGPVASIVPFTTIDAVVKEANRLPFGLAAYAFTRSIKNAHHLSDAIECGMIGINTVKLSQSETPFGGVKESGYGSEGGIEGLDAFLVTKSISMMS